MSPPRFSPGRVILSGVRSTESKDLAESSATPSAGARHPATSRLELSQILRQLSRNPLYVPKVKLRQTVAVFAF